MSYTDTQIKYGVDYDYRIYAYTAVVGTKYRYSTNQYSSTNKRVPRIDDMDVDGKYKYLETYPTLTFSNGSPGCSIPNHTDFNNDKLNSDWLQTGDSTFNALDTSADVELYKPSDIFYDSSLPLVNSGFIQSIVPNVSPETLGLLKYYADIGNPEVFKPIYDLFVEKHNELIDDEQNIEDLVKDIAATTAVKETVSFTTAKYNEMIPDLNSILNYLNDDISSVKLDVGPDGTTLQEYYDLPISQFAGINFGELTQIFDELYTPSVVDARLFELYNRRDKFQGEIDFLKAYQEALASSLPTWGEQEYPTETVLGIRQFQLGLLNELISYLLILQEQMSPYSKNVATLQYDLESDLNLAIVLAGKVFDTKP